MPSSYTTSDRLVKQAPGENNNSWGTILNENLIDMLDEALDGVSAFTLSTTKTLTDEDGVTDESRPRVLHISSGTGGTVTIPNVKKNYLVYNAATGAVTFTTGSGTTGEIAASSWGLVVSFGSNVVRCISLQSATEITAAARTLLDDTTVAAMRATLVLAQGFSFFVGGVPSSSEVVWSGIAPYAMTLTEANCSGKAQTAATAESIYTIKEAGSAIATVTFAAAGTVPTIAVSDSSIAAGAVITVHAPASIDATLADFTVLMKE